MTPPTPTPPQVPLSRGALLGIPVFIALILAAGAVYVIAGWVGWRGNAQILIALCAGPFVGFAIIGLIFYFFRPKINV